MPEDMLTNRSGLNLEFSTPAPEVQNTTYLHFTVDNIGDQSTFVFGGDPTSCDVYIVTEKPISSRLFVVELHSNGRIAILKNLSSRGITISSGIYRRKKVRSQRALVPADEVKICLNEFDISILFIDHADHSGLDEFYLRQLGQRFSEAVPGINQLDLESRDSTLTRSVRSMGKRCLRRAFQIYWHICICTGGAEARAQKASSCLGQRKFSAHHIRAKSLRPNSIFSK